MMISHVLNAILLLLLIIAALFLIGAHYRLNGEPLSAAELPLELSGAVLKHYGFRVGFIYE
jgi:hypothetical protein